MECLNAQRAARRLGLPLVRVQREALLATAGHGGSFGGSLVRRTIRSAPSEASSACGELQDCLGSAEEPGGAAGAHGSYPRKPPTRYPTQALRPQYYTQSCEEGARALLVAVGSRARTQLRGSESMLVDADGVALASAGDELEAIYV